MNSELYSNNNSPSIISDNISNFQINVSTQYKITYIITNILLILTYVISFVLFLIYKEVFSIFIFQNNNDFLMQTHLTSFMVCITIHLLIIIYTLLNAINQKDYDFRKQFFSDKYYVLPLQNLLFIISYVLGIVLNVVLENIEKNNINNTNILPDNLKINKIFSYIFLFIFFFIIICSYLNLRKSQRTVNLSYNSMISFMIQSAVNFSLGIYLFSYSVLYFSKINDIFQLETLETLTITFYVIYTIIGITLLANKDISFSIILIIILVGCICNSYETNNKDFEEKELITLYSCLGILILCMIYISIKYRRKIFRFKADEDLESFINNRFIHDRIDPTI